MKEKKVFCEHCAGTIEHKEDLVTSTLLVGVVAYHEKCFANEIKRVNTFILDNTPLNGFASNVITVISIIVGLIFFLFFATPEKYLSLLAFIPVGYRLVSYFLFERKLDYNV